MARRLRAGGQKENEKAAEDPRPTSVGLPGAKPGELERRPGDQPALIAPFGQVDSHAAQSTHLAGSIV